jgi:hypothetical protein
MAHYVTHHHGFADPQLISGPYPGRGPANEALHALWPLFSGDDDPYNDSIDSPGLHVEEIDSAEPGEMNDKFPPLDITAAYLAELEWKNGFATGYTFTARNGGLIRVEYRHTAGWEQSGWAVLRGDGDTAEILTHADGVWELDRPVAERDRAYHRRTLHVDPFGQVRAMCRTGSEAVADD